MIKLPTILPIFSLNTPVTPETGKQDKVEIEVGTWTVGVSNREEARHIFSRLGPPPAISRGSRLREDHGEAYGWIFNALPANPAQTEYKADVRRSDLQIRGADDSRRVEPPPLFLGACEWKISPAPIVAATNEVIQSEAPPASEGGLEDALETPEEPMIITAKLKLILNPTRFFRYHPTARPSLGERAGMQKPQASSPVPYQETSFDGSDNWIPFFHRRWATLTPQGWARHFARYLSAVETAFQGEFSRASAINCTPVQRPEHHYNVKVVETYWEWVSPNPLKVVDDLIPHLRTFSNRFSGQRLYEALEESTEKGMRILSIQTARGEWLKIYAKTNLRIRIEVTHLFRKGKNQFHFPRETDTQGNIRRNSAHTFHSIQGVQTFLGRLQRRAAHMVNQFLQHVSQRAQIEPSQISAYNALFNVTRAIPDDYPTALALLSLLIHQGGIPSGGDEAKQQGIAALRAYGIIEPAGRGMYVPSAPYRLPFQTLRAHANFTLLTARHRTRNSSSE